MKVKTLILGAGAAGMFCAAHAGGSVLVLDHAQKPGEKIRISGGGRCNFTNLYTEAKNFLSQNPHFAKSALSRYTQWDFIELVEKYGVAWHDKGLGQLFCDGKATQIIDMLRDEMAKADAHLWLGTQVGNIGRDGDLFRVAVKHQGTAQIVLADNLVVATGGKSIPKMGASNLAYQIAEQFGLSLIETKPALVPFTFPEGRFAGISGLSLPIRASTNGTSFDEALLFTHRGLSGPAMLQVSSFWNEGDDVFIDLLPGFDLLEALREERQTAGRKAIKTALSKHIPTRLADHLADELALSGNLADHSDTALATICDALHNWQVNPTGTEGYRTAEVTLGGVDTAGLSSKTMEAKAQPGLYFIGECVDVTGWLGGFNFQWAWSSAYAAATAIRA